jgi:DNA repair photolyase
MVTHTAPHAPILLDIFADGIGIKRLASPVKEEDVSLSIRQDAKTLNSLRSSYSFFKGKPSDVLESQIYSKQLNLTDEVIILGAAKDPFAPDAFDRSLAILETIAHARPRLLCVQTRSPLIVLALPVLKSLGNSVMVTLAFETLSNAVAQQFTPEYSRPDERFKAAQTLRRFGIMTHSQVMSITAERDLEQFVDRLAEVSEFISIAQASQQLQRQANQSIHPYKLASLITERAPKKLLSSFAGLLDALSVDESDEPVEEAPVAA